MILVLLFSQINYTYVFLPPCLIETSHRRWLALLDTSLLDTLPSQDQGRLRLGGRPGGRLSGVVIVIHPERFCSEQARAASTRHRQSRDQSAD